MILPDVNVLVHAHNVDSAVHARARQWWRECLSGSEGIGLAWVALLGFIRLTTNRRIVTRPLHVQQVMAVVAGWLDLPHVHLARPSDTHFARLRTEFERLGTAGNLTTDAHAECRPLSPCGPPVPQAARKEAAIASIICRLGTGYFVSSLPSTFPVAGLMR
jgi:uncharacterized protein